MSSFKILYVDDERENLFSFRATLRRDFDILSAESAAEAIPLLEQEQIGVLVCDQRMPDMTGVELLALAHERWPHISRILVTGYSDMSAVIEAINKGQIYHYLTKPWKIEELKLVLQNALQKTELLIENKALIHEKYQLELVALNAEKSAVEARWQALHSKLQPHFLFNVLNTIPPLVKADPDKAVEFTWALSRLLRHLSEQPETQTHALQDEIQLARDYLFLQSIRFEQKIIVRWDIPEPIPDWNLPRLALQLLIENAIKHNKISRKEPLLIEVIADSKQKRIIVQNSWQPRSEAEEGLGIGLQNIRSRYALHGDKQLSTRVENGKFIVDLPAL